MVAMLQGMLEQVVSGVSDHPWTCVCLAGITVLLWRYVRTNRNLPPGPRGLPFIGPWSCFAEDLPKKMLEWREKYGDIISFYRLGKLHVMLNSERAIREAFVKQGDDFSHRGWLDTLHDFGFYDDIFGGEYSENWKRKKKFAMGNLKTHGFGTAKSEHKFQEQFQFLEDSLLESDGSPVEISKHLQLLCAASVCSIILGGNVSWDDPEAEKLATLMTSHYEESNVVYTSLGIFHEVLPSMLRRLYVRKANKKIKAIIKDLMAFLTEQIKKSAVDISDRVAESVSDGYLKEYGWDGENIKDTAQNIIALLPDSIDTMANVDLWCLLYITLNPDVQLKLHKEIEKVCGSSRSPELTYRAEMPFTQAVIHETLRLSLLIATSLPRVLHKELKLDGYDLPKGTVVEANFYGIHYNPEIFPEPEKFNPSRFIDADGNFLHALAGRLLTFSLGSRKCVGEAYSKVHMFFLVTRLLQRFDLQFDPLSPTPSTDKMSYYLLTKPQEFNLCFKPR